MNAPEAELRAFDAGELDPRSFSHREHLRFGFELLRRYSFGEAAARMARGLHKLAARAGRPEIYHETITVGFLAVIAERQAHGNFSCWRDFIAANRDLMDKNILRRWYREEELRSQTARATFVLPSARVEITNPL